MSRKPRLDFDIRISAQKKQRAQTDRPCSAPGCEGAGEYPAPKGRHRLRDYQFFCLDHIREFNRRWNFFADMDDEEVETYVRNNATWQRPTWKVNGSEPHAGQRFHVVDDMADPLGLAGDIGGGTQHASPQRPRLSKPTEEALAVFELELPVSLKQLKQRYKELVRTYHPDANGGDATSEEQLKRIIWAYNILKSSPVVRTSPNAASDAG